MLNLETLNPQQKEAVMTTEGPLLILAGAGSGKTKVLTYRIAFLIDAGITTPDNILAVTFTNKASAEMKHRIKSILKETTRGGDVQEIPWMGTFHSICMKILRRNAQHIGFDNNFTVYDSQDQQSAVKEAMKRLNIDIKETNPRAVLNYISSAKNELIESSVYESYADGYFQERVAEIYPVYQKVLKENNAMDFDDLIMNTVKLLVENKNILQYFQNTFKYILVDEYQDTNHAQYVLITMLAKEYQNICCVGDDDQSIYAFRGATIKNILSFEKDYPDAKVIKLEQNYRSTKKILDASYSVISKNRSRKDKKLWTENDDGENICLYEASDEESEARFVISKIEEIRKKNEYPADEIYKNFAVLYRTNAQSRSLEESFINSGIPYRIVGGVKFYERKEIKDIISYLRLFINPRDNNSLERIVNLPKRGIGNKTIEEYKLRSSSESKGILEYMVENVSSLAAGGKSFVAMYQDLLEASKKMQIVDFINYVLERTGYVKMLKDGTLENESRIENLKELITVASRYDEDLPPEGLRSFLEEVSLLEGISAENESDNVVTLMTIHSAKGLEFDHVFVVGVEEGLFPHTNSILDQKEMEEERRLAYVAITRAKKNLYLSHAVSRRYFGSIQRNPISRFIEDIDPGLLTKEADYYRSDYSSSFDNFFEDDYLVPSFDFKVGDKVKHEYFGKGVVKYVHGNNIEIDFGPIYGVKELMLEYARLEKL